MWRLSIKNGFSIIEVSCSILIFSIIFSMLITIELRSINLHNESLKLRDYKYFMEALKDDIQFNWNYEDVKLLSGKYIYIEGSNINIAKLEQGRAEDILKSQITKSLPYIEINVQGNDLMTIDIKLYYKLFLSDKVSEIKFLKGKQE